MEKFVVIDIETTGHSPIEDDKIIEVGIVIVEDSQITNHYTTLLNPNKAIPPFIENLTGIQDEDVKNAPIFKEKAKEIVELFQGGYLVAHNVPFDLGFLNEELSRHGMDELTNPVLDTVELARIFYPQAPSYKLAQLSEYLDINHDNPHRALADAHVTGEIFLKLKEKIDSLPQETVTHLLKLEESLNSNLKGLLEEKLEKFAIQTGIDDKITSFRGLAFRKKELLEESEYNNNTSFGDYLDDIYEYKGKLEQELPSYEKRDGQRDMSEDIYDVFQVKNHALIEAETGTGKTLAYLLPAIYEATHKNERIVISTYTTQLQSQLLEEEIPLIKKLVSFSFNIALLKGKHHYLSLERFERQLSLEQKDNYDITLTKAMLLVWLTETKTGDIDEIQLPSSGYHFYKTISTESEGIIDPSSPWFHLSFYQRARLKAHQADIIITNHALLATDVFNDLNLLPSYQKIIVDEAHHLETTASRHFGLKLDYVTLQYTFNQIGMEYDGNWLSKVLSKHRFIREELPEQLWNKTLTETKHEVDDLFRAIFQYVIQQKRHDKSISDTGRIQYRFNEKKEVPRKWMTIWDMALRVTNSIRNLVDILSLIDQLLDTNDNSDKFIREDTIENIQTLQSFIDRINQFFIKEETSSQIKWIEIESYGAKNAAFLYSEPADISSSLKEHFFDKKESVILTSATLTMRNSFSFIQNRLGLSSEEVETTKIQSPFSYEDQVQLLIPNDFPDINNDDLDDFIYSTCEAIISLAHITKGRMLVLFTSYDMLRRAHAILRETLDLDKYMLIAQGVSSGSRSRLKKNFQTFERSILLGTSSFWEGVDIPGDDLSCLVIARLPFQPPSHPVYEAKSEQLKKQGKSPFFELALPQAVIRFKQGFGRLIRSTNDRGIVFVCDARIIEARYGHFFIDSIPNVPISHDSTYNLIEKAEEWF